MTSLHGARAAACGFVLLHGCRGPETAATPIDMAPIRSMRTIDGRPLLAGGQANRPILLAFFRTDSAPARASALAVREIQRKTGESKLALALVSLGEDEASVRRFAIANRLRQSVAASSVSQSREISERFGIRGLPESFLLDARGRIVHRLLGYSTRPDREADFRKSFEKRLSLLIQASATRSR